MLFLIFSVDKALLRNHSFIKPNPYVDLSVDNVRGRKTDFAKNTYLPKWNEDITVLVKPTSELHFKLFDHSIIRKDTLLGEQIISLSHVLQKYNGQCNNLELTMDLTVQAKDLSHVKNGELIVVFNGLKIDMSALTMSLPPQTDSPCLAGGRCGFDVIDAINQKNHHQVVTLNDSNGGVRSRTRRDSRGSRRDSRTSTSMISSPTGTTSQQPSSSNALVPVVQQTVYSPNTPTTQTNTGAIRRSGINWDQQQQPALRPTPAAAVMMMTSNGPIAVLPTVNNIPTSPQQQQLQQVDGGGSGSVSPNQTNGNPAPVANSGDQQLQSAQHNETDILPIGWEIRHDTFGRRYYVDHNTRSTYWERPQELPQGWETKRDPRGRVYYVDHNTRTTTWQRPNQERIQNFQQWQGQREHIVSQGNQRFLYQSSQVVQEDDGLGPLPDGWEKRVQPSNKVYFVNHKNRTTQWEDPRTQGQEVEIMEEPQLPHGWEIRTNATGERYFVDHNTRTTTFQDPRTSEFGGKSKNN